ncbi:MAG TPA: alanine racemase [Hyphomonadaceae bacterium]|nr:alanine racemase [Hyphomonadaceae bacterium]
MAGPRVHIDVGAIVDNWRMFSRRAAPGKAAAVVKADSYGLGAARIAPALARAGCSRFYVAWAKEGVELRKAVGANAEIAVFHGPASETVGEFIAYNLEPVLNSLEQIDIWRGRTNMQRAWSLHVDTGMNRLGLSKADWTEAARLAPSPHYLLSHLACADEDHAMNSGQLAAFDRAAALWPKAPRSFAASGGAYLGANFTLDEVRPGIGLYGGGPAPADGPGPKTVVTVTSPILQIRKVTAGETVGYGATWTADAPKTLATVGLGYADGFLRAASNRGHAVVGGARRPIVGRVSMDLIVVDVTGTTARVGDDIEFLGPNMPLTEVADSMGTIDYELLSRIGPRVERTWSGSE